MAGNIAYSYVPDRGWTGKGFTIAHGPVKPEEVKLTLHPRGKDPLPVAIRTVEAKDGVLEIAAEEFDYRSGWVLERSPRSVWRPERIRPGCRA